MEWLHIHLGLSSSACPAAARLQPGETLSCLRPGAQRAPLGTFSGPVPDGWEAIADGPRGTLARSPSASCSGCPVAGLPSEAIIMGATVHPGMLDLEMAVGSRASLARVLHECQRIGTEPRLKRLSQRKGTGSDPVMVDLARLTPRQVQALRVAAEHGYFRPGSNVMLEDLTKVLGLSKSTLHEHLQKGLSILVEEVVGPPRARAR